MKYAQVLADVAFMHTDHPYDYTIPERFSGELQVGMRVKVNFGGRKVLGFVIGLSDTTAHKAAGEILEILDVFAVVKPDVQTFCNELARRYLTARSQILNFAIPPAAKRVNQKLLAQMPEALPSLAGQSSNSVPTKSTSVLLTPTLHLVQWSVAKVQQLLEQNMIGIVLLPNNAQLQEFQVALSKTLSGVRIGVMSSDLTPSQRYEQFMRVWRNEVHLVIGTRSAVFAPVSKLDFVIMLHENDDSFVEQQSGNWHVRDAALIRCKLAGATFISIGYSRSVELQQEIENGTIQGEIIEGNRPIKTIIVPKDDAVSAQKLRLPSTAFNVIRQGLASGPVLLQVPLRGYQLNIQCARCREKATCDECGGGLEISPQSAAHCTRCGRSYGQFRCQWCSHTQVRSITIGAVRTAEEIGKAFPQIPVFTSGKGNVLTEVLNQPSLIIATPGAEPRVRDGLFAAIVILDPEITLQRIDLRAHEEAFRRWYNLKALADAAGVQLICTQDQHQVIRYIMDDDPTGFAKFQLQERRSAHLPPTTECYLVEGDYENVATAIQEVRDVPDVIILGPAQHKRGSYALFQTTHQDNSLNTALRAILARRSSSKAKGMLRVRYSPQVLP